MNQMDKSLSPLSDRSSSNCSSDLDQMEANIREQAMEDGWFEPGISSEWQDDNGYDHDQWPPREDSFIENEKQSSIKQAPAQSSDSDQHLNEKEYYERYHWDAPEFIFEGDMDAICNTMNVHFKLDMEAQRAAKDRLKKNGYPHFAREDDTLFVPMPTSNRLYHHKHGQFDDAEEKHPALHATSSLQGNVYRARSRRCRMAPY